MDIQTRKLNLISFLAQLQDESLVNKIENFLLGKNSEEIISDFKPLTEEELLIRIRKSEDDFQSGKFKTQEELEKISATW